METAVCETFVTLKINGALISPGLALYSFVSASNTSALGFAVAGLADVAGVTTAEGCGTGTAGVVGGGGVPVKSWADTVPANAINASSNDVKRLIRAGSYQPCRPK